MKAAFGWGLFFVCALIFAILVDTGKKHIGIPDYFWVSANLTLFMYLFSATSAARWRPFWKAARMALPKSCNMLASNS